MSQETQPLRIAVAGDHISFLASSGGTEYVIRMPKQILVQTLARLPLGVRPGDAKFAEATQHLDFDTKAAVEAFFTALSISLFYTLPAKTGIDEVDDKARAPFINQGDAVLSLSKQVDASRAHQR